MGDAADDGLIIDRLTGAFHRRQLDRDLVAGRDRSDVPTASLMIDIDHLERFTGDDGTPPADLVVERVSWVIMATVRATDVVYRHAASGFCVLLPSTRDEDAIAVADRIHSNVAKMPLLGEIGVTISLGVATGPAEDLATSVDRALRALDEAIRTGQPRVIDPQMVDAEGAPQREAHRRNRFEVLAARSAATSVALPPPAV